MKLELAMLGGGSILGSGKNTKFLRRGLLGTRVELNGAQCVWSRESREENR